MKGVVFDKWKNNAKADFKVNLDFLSNFTKGAATNKYVSVLHEEVFSEVNCLECANCCRTTPALVTRPDAKRISKFLSISSKAFIKKYLLEDINGDLMFSRVPCVFLNSDNTCSIYEVRPQACREYPHTDQSGFSRRGKMNAKNTVVCPAVFEIVNRLKAVN